ncbi:mitochondrial import inner membrane translocase subunit TIM44-2-like [Nicotiana tabacum]|uniref:Mitochondrial import inner membrane translocase subunit TIM44-2-like n=1 Tax=Nicotiana tabacum TaxID=4097 RepID=A0A1S4B373_TOBAC|nr:PREDICTED: mitochondrial import inner membrane translocase subunit TIM44-2-like [Nicotiana tabacum]
MASRKLVRDWFVYKNPSFRRILVPPQQVVRLIGAERYVGIRPYTVFNEFSKQVRGEVYRNQEFQRSVKQLKEKAEELKGVKEDFKTRMKQTTGTLYKHVDGVWMEAEATTKKVKDSFGVGKQEARGSSGHYDTSSPNIKESSESASAKNQHEQQSGSSDSAETVFSKVKSAASSKVSPFFQKIKEAKPVGFTKKGYDIILDELKGTPRGTRKHLEYSAPIQETSSNFERSTRTDVVVLPSKQSKWNKEWETFKEKMQGHPLSKSFTLILNIIEDIRERIETSDNPVVHKLQDMCANMDGESSAAMSIKEIYSRDPSFSLPVFVDEVQEMIRPVLNAFFKGDTEVLKKYCSKEEIERCKAEHQAFDSQGIIFDNKILHVSDIEVREKKMMGDSPLIILGFKTQKVYCIRDKLGSIKEGGKDTIHTVHYAWAMQLGEDRVWRLREMQQFGVAALI